MFSKRSNLSRDRATLIALAALTGAITVVIATRPAWLFVHSPAIRAALETIIGLGVLVATAIAFLRVERTRAGNDLALAAALAVVSFTSLLLAVLALEHASPSGTLSWLSMPARLSGGVLFILAGRLRASELRRLPGRLALLLLVTVFMAALALVGVALGQLLHGRVPSWIQFVMAALYLTGALALMRRAQWGGDGAVRWFAAGAFGLAATRLTFTLLAPPASDWLSPGDVVRLVTSLLLLMAVRTELLAHIHQALESGIDDERRRLAREIHDGMAQELAFIVSQSRRLIGREPDQATLELLAEAGQTALADTRRTIYDLKRPSTKALSAAITESTLQVTSRAGLALDMEVDGEVPVSPEVEHALQRIVGEAVSNIAKHGEASTVSIRISSDDGRAVVRIADDGCGFDQRGHQRRRGYGLVSMTERAEALGGRLRMESKPGKGTMIEVAI
jgi:signal transduction histidine kinase